MPSQKKILILNGSHSEIPLIQAAKRLGFFVVTTGNAPHLPGHKLANEYQLGDFSNKEQMLELAKALAVDRICSCANDFGIISAAYVGEQLKMPGHDSYETTLLLHHKDRFKQFAQANDIQTPVARSFQSQAEALEAVDDCALPAIVKPVDMTGGKGVTVADTPEMLRSSITKAFSISKGGAIVIEEFVQGTQHSFSCFMVKQKVHVCFSDNEYSYLNPYLVSTSSAPSSNIEKYREGLIEQAELTARLLNLTDGILHFQYLDNGSQFKIIEMTRRCSGDLYPRPVSIATGIDWGEWIVKAETGADCSLLPLVKQQGYGGRHCIMSPRKGVLKDIVIDPILEPYIAERTMWWKKGDVIHDFLSQKFGILVFNFPTKQKMDELIPKINTLVQVIID